MASGGFFRRIINRIVNPPRDREPPPQPPVAPPRPPAPPFPPPPEDEEVFNSDDDIRTAVKRQKAAFWEDVVGFGRRASDANVDESDAISSMRRALQDENRSDSMWTALASQASYAHKARERYGNAGDLEVFIPFSFLWYHYLG